MGGLAAASSSSVTLRDPDLACVDLLVRIDMSLVVGEGQPALRSLSPEKHSPSGGGELRSGWAASAGGGGIQETMSQVFMPTNVSRKTR